eukprot:5272871-Prymnesium_polylepis.1
MSCSGPRSPSSAAHANASSRVRHAATRVAGGWRSNHVGGVSAAGAPSSAAAHARGGRGRGEGGGRMRRVSACECVRASCVCV